MNCKVTMRVFRRALVRGRPCSSAEARRHLEGCAACRARYDAMFSLDAALAGHDVDDEGTQPLSGPELDWIRGQVLPPSNELAGWFTWHRLGTALAGAAAVSLALLLVLRLSSQTPGVDGTEDRLSGLASRGSGVDAAATAPLGIRAMCLRRTGQGVEVTSLNVPPHLGEPLSCRVSHRIGLAARNETNAPVYLRVVLVGPDATVHRLFPEEDNAVARPLPPLADETPLDLAAPLSVVGAGRVRIVAVFSSSPLPAGVVARAAVDPRPRAALAKLDPLQVSLLSAEVAP